MKYVFSYGGGTDSTAGIIGWLERGEQLEAVVFADTGCEKPKTYSYVETFSNWLVKKGLPEIVVVKNGGKYKSLEDECLTTGTLPPVAFGYKTCSDKYKIQPFKKWIKKQGYKKNEVTALIGYDAGEFNRANSAKTDKNNYLSRYPLIEWGWTRDVCQAVITKAGLPQPGKSACFICPNMKKHEILILHRERPDLIERAILIEDGAHKVDTLAGLGRAWSWKNLICADDAQLKLFADVCMGDPCGCYDG